MASSVKPRRATLLVLIVVNLLTPQLTWGQISWTSQSGGFYESSSNWSASRAPHSDEHIFFGQPGDYAVDFLAGHTVAGLTVTSDARPIFGSPQPVVRTLTVEGDINVSLGAALTLGSTEREGKFTVDNSGYDVFLNGFSTHEQAGALNMLAGSVLTSRSGFVGHTRDSVGRLSLVGDQTAWGMEDLTIGWHGDALVDIAGGASLTSSQVTRIAHQVGSSAIVNVSGVGTNGQPTMWGNRGNETIISRSRGRTEMNISAGAVVTLSPDGRVKIADGVDSVAAVRVSGTDAAGNPSTLTTGDLNISVFGGRTELFVEQGAKLSTGLTQLGDNGTAIVTLSGTDGDGNATQWQAESLSLADGTIEIYDGGRLDVGNELTIRNLATVNLHKGAVSASRIDANGSAGLTVFSDGTLEFNRYEGHLTNTAGTISPGIEFEVAAITGDFVQQPSGILLLEIGGSSGRHDAVGVAGVAEFGGTLKIDLGDDYVPSPSETFPMLSAASVIGSFDNVGNGERIPTLDGKGSFVVNYGAASNFDADRIVLSDFMPVAGDTVGDFNNDGLLDAIDIDLLVAAIGSGNTLYDLTSDGAVDREDHEMWVFALKNTYFGDANMDGEFNSSDFVLVFQRGEYEDSIPGNSSWADGDWDGDRDFNSGDFVLAFQSGGYETGPRAPSVAPESSVVAVPEPTTSPILPIVVLCIVSRWRRPSRSGSRRQGAPNQR